MSGRRKLSSSCRFHHTFLQEILFLGSQEGLQLYQNFVTVKAGKDFRTDKRFSCRSWYARRLFYFRMVAFKDT